MPKCANASTQQLDLEYWITNGFGGTISDGNQIEVTDPGNQGHNYSSEMVAYVNAKPEGTHATWGNYRTVYVAMWEQGHVWNNGANDYICWNAPGCAGGPPDRVTLSNLYCFRFYTYWIQTSEVRGFRVACLQDTPPVSGPPGVGANTVQMVD